MIQKKKKKFTMIHVFDNFQSTPLKILEYIQDIKGHLMLSLRKFTQGVQFKCTFIMKRPVHYCFPVLQHVCSEHVCWLKETCSAPCNTSICVYTTKTTLLAGTSSCCMHWWDICISLTLVSYFADYWKPQFQAETCTACQRWHCVLASQLIWACWDAQCRVANLLLQ